MLRKWHYFNLNAQVKLKPLAIIYGAALAGIVLILSIVFLLFNSLTILSNKTNALDGKRATELIESSINSAQTNLAYLAEDNGLWDDAYRQTQGANLDRAWLYETWGSSADTGNNYQTVFLLDERKAIVWAYSSIDLKQAAYSSYFGDSGQTIINRMGTQIDKKTVTEQKGIIKTPNGPAIMAIQQIIPTTDSLKSAQDQPRYLIFIRYLNQKALDTFANIYKIEDLRLVDLKNIKAGSEHLHLSDANGNVLGALTWNARLPGEEAASAVKPEIIKSMVIMVMAISTFVLLFALTLLKVSISEKKARKAALTDTLSGLPNRLALMEQLKAYQDSKAAHMAALAFIDLDGFKDINDTYGHATGDAVIEILSKEFSARLPKGTLLARLGGDEFAVFCFGPQADNALKHFAQKCLNYLNQPVLIGEHTIRVGASVGMCFATVHKEGYQEILRRADVAMYHSKTTGKSMITVYDISLDVERQKKHDIELGIRRALQNKEFDVFYQPIYNAKADQVTSVEALIRWPRRSEGAIGPDEFIPIAETSGLINPLGLYVLEQACRDMLDVGEMNLSVNVSPAQFRDPDFENKVAKILYKTGFPSSRLELELTEGYLIEQPERAICAINALKGLGISIALDDFGTGYSSIGYLQKYGFNKIKIDKSLAGRVEFDPTSAALVAGTVAIASALSMSVTAEGVENSDQASLLRLAGCHNLQGYLYSKAISVADLKRLCLGAKNTSYISA
jgi:diguanylate cyclase (GGDEF)-like protein